MRYLAELQRLLFVPIVHLSAGPITAATLLVAFAILFAARIVASTTSRTVGAVLQRRGVDDATRFAITKMVRYAILLVGLLIAVNSIGLRLDALVAASAALLVGIGFGLQSIAQNFISGLILLIERPVGKGDFVQIGDASGVVVDIGLRATHVVTRDEVTIIVPNSQLISGQVVNHSMATTRRRVWIEVGVAYGSDAALVQRTLLDLATAEPHVLQEPAPEVRLEKFADSSLVFALLCWIDDPSEDLRISSRLRFAIERAFREHGIQIPFPRQDVHLIEP